MLEAEEGIGWDYFVVNEYNYHFVYSFLACTFDSPHPSKVREYVYFF